MDISQAWPGRRDKLILSVPYMAHPRDPSRPIQAGTSNKRRARSPRALRFGPRPWLLKTRLWRSRRWIHQALLAILSRSSLSSELILIRALIGRAAEDFGNVRRS